MINELFNNVYWKILVVIILSLLATFSHEIDALKDGAVTYIIFVILAMLILTREDIGFVALVSAIFLLAYNNVTRKN